MLGDEGWEEQLRRMRYREFHRIFGGCPEDTFDRVLELGAGNGYQSRLLAGISNRVVATDYAYRENVPPPVEGVEFEFADAESVDSRYPPGSFDLVFSSNLLEHLPEPEAAIRASRRLLTRGGLMVHVVPSTFWKLSYMVLFYPFQARRLLRKVTGKARRMLRRSNDSGERDRRQSESDRWRADNNPKIERSRRSRWREELIPSPHGASSSNTREFLAFRKSRWIGLFEECDLVVAGTIPGPVSSGLGFGFDRVRRLLERSGFAGEYAYVSHRPGERPESLRLIGQGGLSIRPRRPAGSGHHDDGTRS